MKKKRIITCVAGLAIALSCSSAEAGIFSLLSNIAKAMVNLPEAMIAVINNLTQPPGAGGASQMASNTAMGGDYSQIHQSTTNQTATQLSQQALGSQDTFQNQLNAYQAPTQVCDKSGCYSTLNSNVVTGTDTLQGAQLHAAQEHSQLIAGSAMPLAPPSSSWQPTPSAVKYTAYYKTQAAAQSVQSSNAANTLAAHSPANGEVGNQSPHAYNKSSAQSFGSSEIQKELMKIPIIGPVAMLGQGMVKLVFSVPQIATSVANIGTSITSMQSGMSQIQQSTVGQQYYQNAVSEQMGTPNKKGPQ